MLYFKKIPRDDGDVDFQLDCTGCGESFVLQKNTARFVEVELSGDGSDINGVYCHECCKARTEMN